jgi:dipeptidyl aminopeptidase/acylaminoacyl peptidase
LVTRSIAPYGSWKSPITSDLIVAGTITLSDVVVSGDNIYWIESRPAERGRRSIQHRSPDGAITEMTPPEFNVRTRVHEYGGSAYEVAGGTIYFQNFADQLLYRHDPGTLPRPVTTSGLFYGDFRYDRHRDRLVSIQEDHGISDIEAVNTLVSLDPKGPNADGGATMVSGADFVASARISPDGSKMVWLEWSHPNMPWDAAELWIGDLDGEGAVRNGRRIAGGDGSSVFQPEWTPGGDLIFVDDKTGWWNFYRYRDGQIEHLLDIEAEFGRPLWLVGMTTYAVISDERLICTYTQNGFWSIGDLNLITGEFTTVPTPFTEVNSIAADGNIVGFIAGSSVLPMGLYRHDLATGETRLIRSASTLSFDPEYLSAPTTITYPTSDDQVAHAFLYMPKNKDFDGPDTERPPLVVTSHGGPTSAAPATLQLTIQYWTSRGLAVLDVNYRGSTGYGRPYRDALQDTWGIYDVDDCVYGAEYLVEQGSRESGPGLRCGVSLRRWEAGGRSPFRTHGCRR